MQFRIGFFDEDRTWDPGSASIRFTGVSAEGALEFFAAAEILGDPTELGDPPSAARAEAAFDEQSERIYAAAQALAQRDDGRAGSYRIINAVFTDLILGHKP